MENNSPLFAWHSEHEPERREALAALIAGEMDSLANHPGWLRLVEQVNERMKQETDELVKSSKEDERKRGIIAAFKSVVSMPDTVLASANRELNKHRG